MNKKTLLALTVVLAVGGGLPAPLSGIFFVAAIIAFFKLILRVLDDAGEPDFTSGPYFNTPERDDYGDAVMGDPGARTRMGMDN